MSWKLAFPKIESYPVITLRDVREFETRHQMSLAPDYVDFLVSHRGSPPMFVNEQTEYTCPEFTVDWGDKPARVSGPTVRLEATYSIFTGKDVQSAFDSGYDLDDSISWNDHLYPPGLLPIGSNAGNALFMLGVNQAHAGKVFYLSTFHVPDPISFEHIGFIAPTFTDFLKSARPAKRL